MMKLKTDTDNRYIAEQIFLSGVNSVLPDKLIADAVFVDENMLRIANHEFSQIANIWVIGAGKAGAIMALEIEKIRDSLCEACFRQQKQHRL
jgi:glycerate-2-kinase